MRPPHTLIPPRSASTRLVRAFTLVEILVVVAILVILLGLVVGIGSWAVENARARDTRTLLSILDTAAEQFKEDSARTLGRKQEFATRYGGYPPDELDAFLDIPKANDDLTGARISREEFPENRWPEHYRDIRAMSLAVRHIGSSPNAEATLDRIDSRFKAKLLDDGGVPADYWDVNRNNRFDPEIDEPLEYFIDSWGNPLAYFSTRGACEDCGPSTERALRARFSSYLIRNFTNGRPVFLSYGPDGTEQQPGSELVVSGVAQDLLEDYKDDEKINNKYNHDNIYSIEELEKTLVRP